MRPTLRPRLLGHLRDMLEEKEQDLEKLRAKLRASEALQGGALIRLERMEAQLQSCSANGAEAPPEEISERLAALEALAATRGYASASSCDGSFAARVEALERYISQLADSHRQLAESKALLAVQASEAQAFRKEATELRERLAAAEKAGAPVSAGVRETAALQARLAEAVQQASLLGSQLRSKEQVAQRLERRVVELEGWAVRHDDDKEFRRIVHGVSSAPRGPAVGSAVGAAPTATLATSMHGDFGGVLRPPSPLLLSGLQPGPLTPNSSMMVLTPPASDPCVVDGRHSVHLVRELSASRKRETSPATPHRQLPAPSTVTGPFTGGPLSTRVAGSCGTSPSAPSHSASQALFVSGGLGAPQSSVLQHSLRHQRSQSVPGGVRLTLNHQPQQSHPPPPASSTNVVVGAPSLARWAAAPALAPTMQGSGSMRSLVGSVPPSGKGSVSTTRS